MKTFQPPMAWSSGFVQPVAIMAALTACAVLVRLPFLSDVGADEAFYLVVGRQWLNGMPPYAHSFDVKPPLLFGLLAAAEAVFGPSLIAAKALSMAAVSATACALYLFGRRFVGELSGIAAAFLYIVASLTLAGTVSPAELIRAPFIAFAMLAGFAAITKPKPSLWLAAGAGVLFGAAAVVKQTAIFEAAPLAAFLLFSHPRKEGLKAFVLFAAGCFIVPSGFALLFLAEGHFGAFFDAAVISAFGRMNADYVSWGNAVVLFSLELLLLAPLVILAATAWAFRGAFQPGVRPALRFLGAWALGALFGVLAVRAACSFYMQAALPPLCLLAGVLLDHGMARFRAKRVRDLARTIIFASVVIFIANTVRWSCYAADADVAGQAAGAMQAAGLRKQDRILVIDRDIYVYLASGANPPSSIFFPMHLLCDFPFEGAVSALANALDSRPAFIVESDPADGLGCEKPERRALLKSVLADEYRVVGFFGSNDRRKRSRLVVYGLKSNSGNPVRILSANSDKK